ncbi:antibiotic biosynthesis monooxygenase family protein [Propionibacteriaceae bacterium Y1923]
MIVLNRFRVPADQRAGFLAQAQAAVELLRTKPGVQSVDFVQNLDEPDLWALVSHWDQVGSYRRALNGFESKTVIVPMLSLAIDEASAYDDPAHVGINLPRGLG